MLPAALELRWWSLVHTPQIIWQVRKQRNAPPSQSIILSVFGGLLRKAGKTARPSGVIAGLR